MRRTAFRIERVVWSSTTGFDSLGADMKSFARRVVVVSAGLWVALGMTACSRHSYSEQYYVIATNITLPYWQTAGAGLSKAAALYGVKSELRGTDKFDPQG